MNRTTALAGAALEARPRVIAALAAHLRDLDLAEEAFAEALEACLALPEAPRNVAAWLLTVGKRKAVDAIRRRGAEARASEAAALANPGDGDMADILSIPDPIPDERLRLIFICCHPAIALEARAALALKVICGLPVGSIARVFLASEQTMFQRITRAKAKVREAGVPFELPARRFWNERLDAVLLTLELAYTVAYQDAAGELDAELSAEIERLSAMVAELLPEEPEALGLAALVTLARSREAARVDDIGAMIPLSQQDTRLWNFDAIERARRWLDSAAAIGRTGPYQVMAAIQLTHARRAFDGRTDWKAVLMLYNALMGMRPGPMVMLNRALALAEVEGPEAGLEALVGLPEHRLRSARPLHVARANLLARTGQRDAAAKALDCALALDPPRAERLFLERRRIQLATA
ncbi:RNA polymerase sigma factor [Erythrobacter sp. GH1-10]|uniref:RNA polymerase sigma factor n=1 Tax=Erythrobacter sp. GH1-10 TaxID=3349334 RepID=UPI003877BBE8